MKISKWFKQWEYLIKTKRVWCVIGKYQWFVIVVKSMKIEVKQTYVKFSEDLNSQWKQYVTFTGTLSPSLNKNIKIQNFKPNYYEHSTYFLCPVGLLIMPYLNKICFFFKYLHQQVCVKAGTRMCEIKGISKILLIRRNFRGIFK